jgi:hypothetical protein
MLTDEQREQLRLIQRCDPSFLLLSVKGHTNFDAALLEKVFELAKEQARALLDASAAPASDSAVFDALEKLAKGFTRPTDRQFMRHVISTTRALLNEATETVNADA